MRKGEKRTLLWKKGTKEKNKKAGGGGEQQAVRDTAILNIAYDLSDPQNRQPTF